MLLGFVCSCAHEPDPAPMFESRFHTEKDAPLPNGWLPFTDGFYKAPVTFRVNPYAPQTKSEEKQMDPKANTFTVETGESPSMYRYSGYYEVNDDTVIDVRAEAAGKGVFSLGVEFYDSDRRLIGDRHQGFEIIPVEREGQFKSYHYRLYFLANENRKARYARLLFIVDPESVLTLKDISLNIAPYTIEANDSTYIKFQTGDMKEIRKN